MITIGEGKSALVAYTVQDTADMLQINEKAVRDYIKRGDILARKIGKRYYITQMALEHYITPQELMEEANERRNNGG